MSSSCHYYYCRLDSGEMQMVNTENSLHLWNYIILTSPQSAMLKEHAILRQVRCNATVQRSPRRSSISLRAAHDAAGSHSLRLLRISVQPFLMPEACLVLRACMDSNAAPTLLCRLQRARRTRSSRASSASSANAYSTVAGTC